MSPIRSETDIFYPEKEDCVTIIIFFPLFWTVNATRCKSNTGCNSLSRKCTRAWRERDNGMELRSCQWKQYYRAYRTKSTLHRRSKCAAVCVHHVNQNPPHLRIYESFEKQQHIYLTIYVCLWQKYLCLFIINDYIIWTYFIKTFLYLWYKIWYRFNE